MQRSGPVLSSLAAMTPAAQKPLTKQRQAAAAAPVAVHTSGPEPIGGGSVFVQGRHRVRCQNITLRPPR